MEIVLILYPKWKTESKKESFLEQYAKLEKYIRLKKDNGI